MLTAKSAAACATTTKLRLSLNMMLGRTVQILSGCAALTPQRGVVALVILGFAARQEMAQTVAVAAPVQVSPAGSGHHWFTSIAAAPDDARHLVACGIRQTSRQNSWQGFVYTSHDGGARWAVALVDSSTQDVSEETCAFGPEGAAYFVAEPWGREHSPETGVMHLYRSRDWGYTWSGPVSSGWLDYARVAVDNTTGVDRGRLYIFGNGGQVGKEPDGTRWVEKELVYSADGGRTLSKRVRPPRATTYRTIGNYPEHARVLPDGAVLAVYWTRYLPLSPDSTKTPRRYMIEAVRTTDGGQTVALPVVVARMSGAKDGVPAMDVDAGDGRWRGRVYVAWSDSLNGHEHVFLTTSEDQGATWSKQQVVDDTPGNGASDRGQSATNPSLAVNKDGVVAITWVEQHGDCRRISASLDGGVTFLPSVPLNPCPRRTLAGTQYYSDYLWAVPFVQFESNRFDSTRSGFTIRVYDVAGALPYGLAAARDGTFHPLWALPHDGGGQLWTTTVTVPEHAARRVLCTINGLVDVTAQIEYTLTNVQYDQTTETVSVDLSLFNRDTTALRAPLCLRMVAARSPIASVAAKNADNGLATVGAIWDLSTATEDSVLRPYQETRPRRLVFAVKGVSSPAPADYISLSLVAVETRVFARLH